MGGQWLRPWPPILFATIYNPLMRPLDKVGFRDWRAWAVALAKGRVLEIGVGTGLNLSLYSADAQVFAIDPSSEHLSEIETVHRYSCRIHLVQARAEELPFPPQSFDSAVGTLVFCTIPNVERALAELRRVLRPGSRVRLVEHVRAHNAILGGLMDIATPVWSSVAGGCHLNRDTFQTVLAAGFEIVSVMKKWRGLVIGIDAQEPAAHGRESAHSRE